MDIKNDGMPSNLEEAMETLIEFETIMVDLINKFPLDDTKKIISFLHHNVGRFIRNSWFLWWKEGHGYEEWPKDKPAIVTFFNNNNIYHADDMSSIILTSVIRKLKGVEIDFNEQIKYYIGYWKANGFPDGIPK